MNTFKIIHNLSNACEQCSQTSALRNICEDLMRAWYNLYQSKNGSMGKQNSNYFPLNLLVQLHPIYLHCSPMICTYWSCAVNKKHIKNLLKELPCQLDCRYILLLQFSCQFNILDHINSTGLSIRQIQILLMELYCQYNRLPIYWAPQYQGKLWNGIIRLGYIHLSL